MKIAIFSDTFPPQINGVANVVYKSAVELVKLGHEVLVFTISNGSDDKMNDPELFKADGFELNRITSVPIPVYPGFRFALPINNAIVKLRKFKPDIIHTHTPFSVGWSLIGPAKLFHIPVVGTHHTFYDQYLKHAHLDYDWVKKLSWSYTLDYYNRCDIVLSPSRSLAEELQKHGLKKPFEIFSNSVDTNLFQPVLDNESKKKLKKSWNIDGKSLAYMGRVSYEKSIDIVIMAFNEVIKKNPVTKLMIIGDGPERDNLEKLVSKLNIQDNVIFTGFLQKEELVNALLATDIFLTASKTENMPVAVMEGMAAGLPIVAVDALGTPEIVKDGVNGFLTQPDDYMEMAEKTLQLLKDEETSRKFAKASIEFSSNFSQENMGKALEKIYLKLLSN
ncbi:MAG: glycosyltransferase [bacterium]